MKAERYFYSTAALVMLAITFAGFQPYYLAGEGMSGRQIAPELFTLVLVHARDPLRFRQTLIGARIRLAGHRKRASWRHA